MTERLYYTDSGLREFTAKVVAHEVREDKPAVRLDRTAFYPTSGGQPHDTGTLDSIAVHDVSEDDHGEIWHYLERPPDSEQVHGEIDWDRRFDHMQQHSGQHLLSAAFVHLLNAPTIGFHLGTEASHIDLNTPSVSWDEAFRVEADVNRIIQENKPVDIHFVDESEIHTVPLRRPPKVGGTIRVIWVKDYDAAACGGTHVKQTGAIGLLKITHIERYKGGMRVGFRCGQRALKDYQRALRTMQEVSADLSVHQDQLGQAVGRLKGELRETRQALRAAQGAQIAFEAEKLLAQAEEEDGIRRVVSHLKDRSFDETRAIASHVCSLPRTLALLAATEAKGVRLICERAEDLDGVDAADILCRAAESLGGRGGGTSSLAQGGAPAHPHEEVQQALRDAALP